MPSDETAAGPPLPGQWERPGLQGFAELIGPVWRESASGRLALRITPAHLNPSTYLHGGTAMSLFCLALLLASRHSARQADLATSTELLTFNCELPGSAAVGDWIEARPRVMRLTRTLVFVSGDLCCGERLMMNGSAVFRIVPALEDGPPRQTVAEIPPAPYQVYDPPGAVDPFYVLAGLFYERFDETGARHGAFHVSPRHLDPEGRAQVDTGILLLLLDKFIGRHARNYAGTGCVTLGVTVSQTAAVRLGDLVEISSRAEGKTGEFAILTGSMRVGDLQVMSVTSSWKMIRGLAT